MIDLLELQKYFIMQHIKEGDTVVDFTMGNGNDTAFLSSAVGASGKVFAFDIQEDALKSTEARLKAMNAPENYTLICASHHLVKDYVKEPIKAGMFNLGYLPGSGRKNITTMRETTMPAVIAALELLSDDGILMVAIYPGHEEGDLEGKMLADYFATLERKKVCASMFKIVNSPTSPYFYIIEKK